MAPDQWPHRSRDLDGAWRAIEDLRWRVDRMASAEEVAKAVTEQMRARTVLGLTALQKTLAAVAAGAMLGGSILDIIRGLH